MHEFEIESVLVKTFDSSGYKPISEDVVKKLCEKNNGDIVVWRDVANTLHDLGEICFVSY